MTTLKQVLEEAPRGFEDSEPEARIFWDNDRYYWEKESPAEFWGKFEEAFSGVWQDEEDFAYFLAEECGILPSDDFARGYFDVASFARDLFLGDYWGEKLEDGSLVVFRNY